MNVICDLLGLAAIALSVLDVLSTLAFLKAGKGTEANALSAWLQKTFPKAWVDIRIVGGMAVAVVALLLPTAISFVVLAVTCAWWSYVVYNNYKIAAGK